MSLSTIATENNPLLKTNGMPMLAKVEVSDQEFAKVTELLALFGVKDSESLSFIKFALRVQYLYGSTTLAPRSYRELCATMMRLGEEDSFEFTATEQAYQAAICLFEHLLNLR